MSLYEQSVALFREIGDQWALAHPLCDLALRIWDEGRLHEAIALIQEYLAVFRQLRSFGGVPMALGYLSFMAVGIGDFAAAAQAAQEKSEIEASRRMPNDRANGLNATAYVHLVQGNLAAARDQLQEALALDSLDQGFVADILYLLGQVAFYEDCLDEATERLNESRRLGGGTDRPWLETQVIFVLGQVATRRKEYVGALALIQESLVQYQEVRPQIPARLEGLAQAYAGLGQSERAATLLGAASHLRVTMGAPVLPVDRPNYDSTLNALRATFNDGEFRQAWAVGQSLSFQESVAYALDDKPDTDKSHSSTRL